MDLSATHTGSRPPPAYSAEALPPTNSVRRRFKQAAKRSLAMVVSVAHWPGPNETPASGPFERLLQAPRLDRLFPLPPAPGSANRAASPLAFQDALFAFHLGVPPFCPAEVGGARLQHAAFALEQQNVDLRAGRGFSVAMLRWLVPSLTFEQAMAILAHLCHCGALSGDGQEVDVGAAREAVKSLWLGPASDARQLRFTIRTGLLSFAHEQGRDALFAREAKRMAKQFRRAAGLARSEQSLAQGAHISQPAEPLQAEAAPGSQHAATLAQQSEAVLQWLQRQRFTLPSLRLENRGVSPASSAAQLLRQQHQVWQWVDYVRPTAGNIRLALPEAEELPPAYSSEPRGVSPADQLIQAPRDAIAAAVLGRL